MIQQQNKYQQAIQQKYKKNFSYQHFIPHKIQNNVNFLKAIVIINISFQQTNQQKLIEQNLMTSTLTIQLSFMIENNPSFQIKTQIPEKNTITLQHIIKHIVKNISASMSQGTKRFFSISAQSLNAFRDQKCVDKIPISISITKSEKLYYNMSKEQSELLHLQFDLNQDQFQDPNRKCVQRKDLKNNFSKAKNPKQMQNTAESKSSKNLEDQIKKTSSKSSYLIESQSLSKIKLQQSPDKVKLPKNQNTQIQLLNINNSLLRSNKKLKPIQSNRLTQIGKNINQVNQFPSTHTLTQAKLNTQSYQNRNNTNNLVYSNQMNQVTAMNGHNYQNQNYQNSQNYQNQNYQNLNYQPYQENKIKSQSALDSHIQYNPIQSTGNSNSRNAGSDSCCAII